MATTDNSSLLHILLHSSVNDTQLADQNVSQLPDFTQNVSQLPDLTQNVSQLPDLTQNFSLQTTTAIIEAAGLLGNAIVIFVILRTKALRSRLPNQFIVNQSIIDFCSCICLISLVLPRKKSFSADDMADQLYCKLIQSNSFSWGLLFSSTYSLIALTIERYLSIVHPIWHKQKCSKKRAYFVMLLTWFFGFAEGIGHAVPTSYIENGVCYTFSRWPNNWVRSFAGLITCTLHYILPIAVLVFLYGKIIMVITGRINKVASLNPPTPPVNLLALPPVNHDQVNIIQPQAAFNVAANQNPGPIWPKAKRNVIHTLVLVSVLFALCWSMNQIYYLMMCLGYPPDFTSTFYNVTILAIYLNSCLNPIVYFVKYDQFRKAAITIFRPQWGAAVGSSAFSYTH